MQIEIGPRRLTQIIGRVTSYVPAEPGSIEDSTIDTEPWITHRTPFDQMIGEFESYTKPETGVIKAIVEVQ